MPDWRRMNAICESGDSSGAPPGSEWAKPERVLSHAEWFCFVKASQSRGGRNFALMCCSTRTFCRFFATSILRSPRNPLRFGKQLSSTSSLGRPAGKRRGRARAVPAHPTMDTRQASLPDSISGRGNGGERQQLEDAEHTVFTTDQSIAIVGSRNPLRANAQGSIFLVENALRREFASFAHQCRKPGIRALVSAYVSIL